MLTEIYIEALLVDEELADLVWEAWDAGLIADDLAAWAWFVMLPAAQVSVSGDRGFWARGDCSEAILSSGYGRSALLPKAALGMVEF